MTRDQKTQVIERLAQSISEANHFYLADISALNAEDTSKLRRKCFEKDIKLVVVKNTLLKRALEQAEGDYSELYPTLHHETSVMFTEVGNAPAKLIKEFRKDKEIV